MLSLYDRIESLCKSHGITITELCRQTGIPRSILSDYKAGRNKSIGVKYLEKIAAHFNTSVDYLLGIKKTSAQSAEVDDHELIEILEAARRDPNIRALFSLSRKAKPEDVKKYLEIIKLMRGGTDESSDY